MSLGRWAWPGIILFSAVATGVTVLGDLHSPLRPPLALWFLFVCPGMAFVRLLHIRDRLAEWTLAIALSLAIDSIVAATSLYSGVWSPKWSLILVICVSLIGVLLQAVTLRSPR